MVPERTRRPFWNAQPNSGRIGFQEAPKPGRHGAGDLLQPRMHVFGGVDDLPVADAVLAQHPVVAACPRLQIGDADDVVIGHGDRDIFRRRRRERVVLERAAIGLIELIKRDEAVEIVARVGRILKVGEMLHAGIEDRMQRFRKFADARQQLVKVRPAGGSGQEVEALGRPLDRRALRAGRLLRLGIRGPECFEA